MAFTSTPPRSYDVFLSFRGKDTREGFTESLYQKLRWHNLVVFKDDEVPERGMPISEKLLTAIEESKTAIVVLSPNFASSTWCLDELLKILECMEARKAVFPVFYDVDPADVRHKLGSFKKAFEKHEQRIKDGLPKVQLWRDALTKLANFVGWTSKDYGSEAELIDGIVEHVQSKVNPILTLSGSTEKLVGMDIHLKEFMQYFEPEAADVRYLGICGMGGVGKTTLAKFVYERFSHNFEVSCFLENVNEVHEKQGPVHLQNQLLSQIFKENFVQHVSDVHKGSSMIQKSLQNKRVLLILDDVWGLRELDTLASKADWFGKRSRIIITTRVADLLGRHGVDATIEMYLLHVHSDEGSYQLFSRKAFHTDTPPAEYIDFCHVFIRYCRGHSLSLKILGSFLYNKGPDIWESTLNKLRTNPQPDYRFMYVLRLGYDGLNENEKQVFLDIACFFRGERKEQVIKILGSNFIEAHVTVNALVEKSFLTISSNNSVEVHDVIQYLGREIVCEECPMEPGRRSRLWREEDIMHVLAHDEGTEAIEGILLDLPDRHYSRMIENLFNPKSFAKMSNLRYLKIHNLRLSLPLISKYLPHSLRHFEWSCSQGRNYENLNEQHIPRSNHKHKHIHRLITKYMNN